MNRDGNRSLYWHRRDLRAVDNRGLARATLEGTAIPVFCFDEEVLSYAGAPRVAFLLEALADLRSWYRERDADLLVVRDDPAEVIPALASEFDVDGVVWNEDYSGLARERDMAVEDALLAGGFDTTWVQDQVLHEPGSIRTNEGEPYSVFTYYWTKWRDRTVDPVVDPPASSSLVPVSSDTPMPTLEDLGFAVPEAAIPSGTRSAAVNRLETFLDGPIYEYADRRDLPAAAGTSRLSQDVKFGLLGVREVFERVRDAERTAPSDAGAESVEAFKRQLAWREFYAQVLAFNPSIVTENVTSYPNDIEWRDDPSGLETWKRGETGYPIVDAGMRQLRREGYVHNRVRMIVASFLTKDLLIDWREGYEWFRERLVDHDTANDVGGWQWAASTGTDAQPYFRIFNPTTQGERYDPDGEYVREYVDELATVEAETIHSWPDLSPEERREVAPEYPAPIVDHGDRRTAAIEAFERARGDD
ncbi:MAG: deoxyribodipyrimidine photo-lyase [Halanaeroarchaeum sp.]